MSERPPFPLGAVPPIVRDFARELADATNTCASWAAVGAMVACAGAVGNRSAVVIRAGWSEPSILWAALVGRSGTMKSPVLKAIRRPFTERYARDRAAYAAELQNYAAAWAEYDRARREWRQNGSKTDAPVEPEKPVCPRVIVGDITTEKLGELLSQNNNGLFVLRDELSAWAASFDRYSNGRGADRSIWLPLYDADSVTVDRRADGASFFVPRGAVSILGGIQPGTLLRAFGRGDRDAGLLARLLLIYPPEHTVIWSEAELSEKTAGEWATLVQSLLDITPGVGPGGVPQPRFVGLSTDAKRLFRSFVDANGRETSATEDDDLRAHLAKLRGVCARLSLILTCAGVASGGGSSARIEAHEMENAITITRWLAAEATRVYAELAVPALQREARKAVATIVSNGGSVSVRHWQRLRGFDTATQAEASLHELGRAGYGRMVTLKPEGRGRPSLVFELHECADTDKNPITPGKYAILSVSDAQNGDGHARDHDRPPLTEPDIDPDDDRPPETHYLDCPEAWGGELEE